MEPPRSSQSPGPIVDNNLPTTPANSGAPRRRVKPSSESLKSSRSTPRSKTSTVLAGLEAKYADDDRTPRAMQNGLQSHPIGFVDGTDEEDNFEPETPTYFGKASSSRASSSRTSLLRRLSRESTPSRTKTSSGVVHRRTTRATSVSSIDEGYKTANSQPDVSDNEQEDEMAGSIGVTSSSGASTNNASAYREESLECKSASSTIFEGSTQGEDLLAELNAKLASAEAERDNMCLQKEEIKEEKENACKQLQAKIEEAEVVQREAQANITQLLREKREQAARIEALNYQAKAATFTRDVVQSRNLELARHLGDTPSELKKLHAAMAKVIEHHESHQVADSNFSKEMLDLRKERDDVLKARDNGAKEIIRLQDQLDQLNSEQDATTASMSKLEENRQLEMDRVLHMQISIKEVEAARDAAKEEVRRLETEYQNVADLADTAQQINRVSERSMREAEQAASNKISELESRLVELQTKLNEVERQSAVQESTLQIRIENLETSRRNEEDAHQTTMAKLDKTKASLLEIEAKLHALQVKLDEAEVHLGASVGENRQHEIERTLTQPLVDASVAIGLRRWEQFKQSRTTTNRGYQRWVDDRGFADKSLINAGHKRLNRPDVAADTALFALGHIRGDDNLELFRTIYRKDAAGDIKEVISPAKLVEILNMDAAVRDSVRFGQAGPYHFAHSKEFRALAKECEREYHSRLEVFGQEGLNGNVDGARLKVIQDEFDANVEIEEKVARMREIAEEAITVSRRRLRG